MSKPPLRLAVAAGAAVAALVLAGCSGSASGDANSANKATGSPIVVAATTSLAVEPETTKAARAVFDDFNNSGGLDGHPIELKVYDDKSDPATSATAAKSIVSSDAVAVVGGGSQLDCAINGKTWTDNSIIDIPGVATDPYCYGNANIAPTNSGAFMGAFSSLYDGSQKHHLKKICAEVVYDNAVAKSVFEQAFDAWTKATGKKLAYVDSTLTRGQASYAANVSRLKSHGCDAIFINDYADAVVNFLGEATNQGVKLPVLGLTSVYSDQFAASAASYSGPVYVPAEYVPYFDTSNKDVAAWAKVMKAHAVPQTSFAEGGYVAANDFIELLKTVHGDITRQSVMDAAKKMTAGVDSPLTEGTWILGAGDAHQPNTNSWPVVLKPGAGAWAKDGKVVDGAKLGWAGLNLTAG